MIDCLLCRYVVHEKELIYCSHEVSLLLSDEMKTVGYMRKSSYCGPEAKLFETKEKEPA